MFLKDFVRTQIIINHLKNSQAPQENISDFQLSIKPTLSCILAVLYSEVYVFSLYSIKAMYCLSF